MATAEKSSEFDLLKGRATFNNEPWWVRFLTIVLIIIFWGFVIWQLGSTAYAAWGIKQISKPVISLISKSRSP